MKDGKQRQICLHFRPCGRKYDRAATSKDSCNCARHSRRKQHV